MDTHKFSIKAAFSFGWQKTKQEFIFLFTTLVVVFALSSVISYLVENRDSFFNFAFLAPVVFGIFINIGIIKILLAIVGNEKPKVAHFLSISASEFFNYVGCAILYGLAIVIGTILLIVPGIIAFLRLQFGYYYVVEKNMGPLEALKASFNDTKGETLNLLLFTLLAAVMNLIGTVFFGLGLIVTIPITMIALVYIYKKVSGALLPQVIEHPLPAETK